jgi:hypothetical protein
MIGGIKAGLFRVPPHSAASREGKFAQPARFSEKYILIAFAYSRFTVLSG